MAKWHGKLAFNQKNTADSINLRVIVIVNFYFWLTRATIKTKKSTLPNQKKENSHKTIYVETCTILSFINHTQKAMQCMVAEPYVAITQ